MNFTLDSAFLNALANPAPTPAGGSAAAYAGAMAAALVVMVAQTTLSKKKYADVQDLMRQMVAEAEACRDELELCVRRDAEAFEGLLAAYRAAKEVPNPAAVAQATLYVTIVPLGTANTALHVLELAVKVAATGNINAIGDAYAAASLAQSCISISALNVKVNLKSLDDRRQESILAQICNIEAQAKAFITEVQQIIKERGGIG